MSIGPVQYGIFGADADVDMREQKNSEIWYALFM